MLTAKNHLILLKIVDQPRVLAVFIRYLKRHFDGLIGIAIMLLGALLRIEHYSSVPEVGWTFDEYAFAWSGMSLIQEGIPTSWSYLVAYDPQSMVNIEWLGKTNLFLTSPWLDHPPLFSLIIGSASLLGGARTFFECDPAYFRLPVVILGSLSVGLLYMLTQRLFGRGTAIVATLLFATNPSLIFLSRLAVSENLIVPILLAVIILFDQFDKTSKPIYFYSAALLAGLSILAKLTGIFVVLLLCLMLAYRKKWKSAVIAALIGLAFLFSFFVYGYIYDFDLFLSVLKAHSKRFSSLVLIHKTLLQEDMPIIDGWWILGWLTLPNLIERSKDKRNVKIISLSVLVYLFLLLLMGAQSHFFAWYNIPLYPFLSIALGVFLLRFINQPSLPVAGLLVISIFTLSINYGTGHPWSDFYPLQLKGFKYIFQFLILGSILPFLTVFLFENEKTKAIAKISAVLLVAFCLTTNVVISHNLPTILQSSLVPSNGSPVR